MSTKYLIKEDKIFMPSIKKADDETQAIPLDNIRLKVSSQDDPEKVILLSSNEVNTLISQWISSGANNVGEELVSSDDLTEVEIIKVQDRYQTTGIEIGSAIYQQSTNPLNEGDTFLSVLVENGVETVSNMFMIFNGKLTQITFASASLNTLRQVILEVDILRTTKAERTETLLTDGSNDMDPGYAPNNNKSVVTKEYSDSERSLLEDSIKGANATKTIADLEAVNVITNGRLAALEADEIKKYTKGKFKILNANITPFNSPGTEDNLAIIDVPVVDDDGVTITRAEGDSILFAVEGDDTAGNTWRKTYTLEALSTANLINDVLEQGSELVGIDLNGLAITGDGDITFTNPITDLDDGSNVVVKLTKTGGSIYLNDSFNDGNGTDQTTTLDNKDTPIRVNITSTGITFRKPNGSPLGAGELTDLKTYTGDKLEQFKKTKLLASFNSDTNELMIERVGGGKDIDFSTIVLRMVEQDIFVGKNEVATKDELNQSISDQQTVNNEKLEKNQAPGVLTDGTYGGATNNSLVVGKINEHTSAISYNAERTFTGGTETGNQVLRELEAKDGKGAIKHEANTGKAKTTWEGDGAETFEVETTNGSKAKLNWQSADGATSKTVDIEKLIDGANEPAVSGYVDKTTYDFNGKTKANIFTEFGSYPLGTMFKFKDITLNANNIQDVGTYPLAYETYKNAIGYLQETQTQDDVEIVIKTFTFDLFKLTGEDGDTSLKIFNSGIAENFQSIATLGDTIIDTTHVAGVNFFRGKFSSVAKHDLFAGITTQAVGNLFANTETELTFIELTEAITVGDTVDNIGIFQRCGLKKISLPVATTIGNGAFSRNQLTSIEIPVATTIGIAAFELNNIGSMNLPNATTIGDRAFYHNQLTSIDLPQATTIGSRTFYNNQLTSINLPVATTIGRTAFKNNQLTSIDLPQATTIGDQAFFNNPNIATATLNYIFNTDEEKDRIFGTNSWSNISFTWV